MSGFGFLSFELEESVNAVVAERFVTINNKKVSIMELFARSFATFCVMLRTFVLSLCYS